MSGISVVKVVKILLTDKSFQFILYSDCYGIFAGICLVRMNLFLMGILFLMKHGSYQTYCFVYCSFLCTFYWHGMKALCYWYAVGSWSLLLCQKNYV